LYVDHLLAHAYTRSTEDAIIIIIIHRLL